MGAPRINLVTLGVSDMLRARAFYEALGFIASGASVPSVSFFAAGGVVLALYGRGELAADAQAQDTPTGFAAVTLAWNLESEAEVDAAMALAARCGARIAKPAQKVFWGGYSGYFADPDGHLWEVAYNPFFPLDAAGRIMLPATAAGYDETGTP
jgi:catechol 2,3-dioxygenase-like lactoylglutathione lyase family enzyme